MLKTYRVESLGTDIKLTIKLETFEQLYTRKKIIPCILTIFVSHVV